MTYVRMSIHAVALRRFANIQARDDGTQLSGPTIGVESPTIADGVTSLTRAPTSVGIELSNTPRCK